MSGPDTADAGHLQAPASLLEKLMAAVRPEFRAEILTFGAETRCSAARRARCPAASVPPGTGTVLGAPPALAPARKAGPGRVHGVHQPGVSGQLPLPACETPGCIFCQCGRGL